MATIIAALSDSVVVEITHDELEALYWDGLLTVHARDGSVTIQVV